MPEPGDELGTPDFGEPPPLDLEPERRGYTNMQEECTMKDAIS